MEAKDVKKILDIPNIEDYLTDVFMLDLYEVGDKTIIYKTNLPNRHSISIDMHSDESLILGKLDLAEIIAHYKIGFLNWVEFNDLGNVVSNFMYRPLIYENRKNY